WHDVAPEPRDRGDPPARRPAGRGAEGVRGPPVTSAEPIRALILLDTDVARETVEPLFAENAEVRVTDVLAETGPGWRPPPPGLLDVLVIACSGASDGAIDLISSIAHQRPQLPLVVCNLATTELDGFMHRVFTAGADELVSLPEPPEKLAEVLRKAIARNRGTGG